MVLRRGRNNCTCSQVNQSEKTVNKTDEAAAAAAGERAHAHVCDRARTQASWCILILARAQTTY